LRIKGQGILFHATRQRGDMYVVVKLALPPNLTDEARDLFRKIDQLCPSNPRQGLW
jgi:DnaJ-class molecular chaperone